MKPEVVHKLNDLENALADMFTRECDAVLAHEGQKEVFRMKNQASATGMLLLRIQWMFKHATVNPKMPRLPEEDEKFMAMAEQKANDAIAEARKSVRTRIVNGGRY